MQGNIKLTARRVLAIQASQLKHHSEAIRAKIAEQTNVKGLDLDEELPAHIINRHVPRGGAIEVLAYAEKMKDAG